MDMSIFSMDFVTAQDVAAKRQLADQHNAQKKATYMEAALRWQQEYIAHPDMPPPKPVPALAEHVDDKGNVTTGPDTVCPMVEAPKLNTLPSSGLTPAGDPNSEVKQVLDWHSQMLVAIGQLLGEIKTKLGA